MTTLNLHQYHVHVVHFVITRSTLRKLRVGSGIKYVGRGRAHQSRYQNHRGVGEALKRAIQEGIVTRADIFLVTKLWMTHFRPDLVRPAVGQMLEELGVDYVDQMLLHWSLPFEYRDPKDE